MQPTTFLAETGPASMLNMFFGLVLLRLIFDILSAVIVVQSFFLGVASRFGNSWSLFLLFRRVWERLRGVYDWVGFFSVVVRCSR